MKNFQNYTPEKYSSDAYQLVEEGIYRTKNPYPAGARDDKMVFVTSISFEMEPEVYGEEEGSPQYMPQDPIEGILDEFNVFVSDFYEALNEQSVCTCYQEFASSDLEDIQKLRALIGRRFYAVPYIDEEDEEEYYRMVME